MGDRPHAAAFDDLVIEAQLAHKLPGVKGIYNRGIYLARRAEVGAFEVRSYKVGTVRDAHVAEQHLRDGRHADGQVSASPK